MSAIFKLLLQGLVAFLEKNPAQVEMLIQEGIAALIAYLKSRR